MSFHSQQNKRMVWSLLRDNYGEEQLQNFKDTFEYLLNQINHQSSRYNNLIDMNKALVLQCSQYLSEASKVKQKRRDAVPAPSRSKSFEDKQNEFKQMMDKEKPPQIDFEDTKTYEFNGKISDLMSKQLSERTNDMKNITQTYDTKNAQQWINNEVPPAINIDHAKSANIKVEVLVPKKKRVTFEEPPPFLDKFKKIPPKTPPEIKTQYLSPSQIEKNTFYFNDIIKNTTDFSISKAFFHNGTITHTNKLQQKIEKNVSDEICMFGKISIQSNVDCGTILFIKKYSDENDVVYESDERIDISTTNLKITFFDRNNEPLIVSPLLAVNHFVKGSALHIKSSEQQLFFDNKYGYIMLENDLLLVGEKILINNDTVSVIGSCKINVKDGQYHLEDIDGEHNCAIVEWDVNNMGKTPTIYRAPLFVITS